MMPHVILSNVVANISELKKNPMETVHKAHGEPLAILNHNEPVFYCITQEKYEEMLDIIEDFEISRIVKARENDPEIEVNIYDL
jgi:antitoxin StbD